MITLFFIYLDPGSGSIFAQVIIASVLGLLFTFRIHWQKVLSFFKRQKNPGK